MANYKQDSAFLYTDATHPSEAGRTLDARDIYLDRRNQRSQSLDQMIGDIQALRDDVQGIGKTLASKADEVFGQRPEPCSAEADREDVPDGIMASIFSNMGALRRDIDALRSVASRFQSL